MSILAILELIAALGATIKDITATMNQIIAVVQRAQAEGRELSAEEVALIQGIRKASEDELETALKV